MDDVFEFPDIDKRDHNYSIRVSEKLLSHISLLPPTLKKKLVFDVLVTMARVCNEYDFDPNKYLKS